jgi:hypothetical protein
MRRLITFVTSVGIPSQRERVDIPGCPAGQRPGRRDGPADFEDFADWYPHPLATFMPGEPDLTCAHQRGEIAMHSLNRSSTRLRRNARLGVLSALAAGGMLLAMVQPAAAQLVDRSHQHFVATIPNQEVCGVQPVTITVDIIVNDQERLAQSGFPLFKDTGRGTVTWTNPANGKSVTEFFAGLFTKDLTVVDNGDGTITLRTAVTGVAEKVTQSNGKPLLMDVGRVVFVSVLDYNGTPTNDEDDVLISQSIESISGPHPDLQSDSALFCEVVVPALT